MKHALFNWPEEKQIHNSVCFGELNGAFDSVSFKCQFCLRCFYKSKQKTKLNKTKNNSIYTKQKTNKQKQTLIILKCELKYRHLTAC